MPATTPNDDPPPRVVWAARGAFLDAITESEPLLPVHDAWDDRRGARVLVFRSAGVALVLACRTVPGGLRVSGKMIGAQAALRVVVHRPGRPCLRLATTADDKIQPATLPRGLVSITAEYCDHGAPVRWRSDWIKL